MIVGMGQAGTGIALNILTALKEEGLSAEEARARVFAVDMQGCWWRTIRFWKTISSPWPGAGPGWPIGNWPAPGGSPWRTWCTTPAPPC